MFNYNIESLGMLHNLFSIQAKSGNVDENV